MAKRPEDSPTGVNRPLKVKQGSRLQNLLERGVARLPRRVAEPARRAAGQTVSNRDVLYRLMKKHGIAVRPREG